MIPDISTIEQELTAAIVKAVQEIATPCYLAAEDNKGGGILIWSEAGRPITLEDVLRAVFTEHNHYCVDMGGQIWDLSPGSKGKLCRWFLGKPLSEQSEETKRFLHSLLI